MLFFEYALDPTLLSNWKDFRYFIEKFGWIHGRFISKFPKKWKKMVYESISKDCKDVEKKMIEERLTQIDNKLINTRSPEIVYNKNKKWIKNAINEHKKQPFFKIICKNSSFQCEDILIGEEMNEEHWKIPEKPMGRTVQEIQQTIGPLLRISNHIKLIDQYFDPNESRYKKIWKLLLKDCFNKSNKKTKVKLEIHVSTRKGPSYLENGLKSIVPKGEKIKLFIWKKKNGGEKIHNRYILTEFGGVLLGIGLDKGNEGETDDIIRMSEDNYLHRWKQYSEQSIDFESYQDPIEIIGESKY